MYDCVSNGSEDDTLAVGGACNTSNVASQSLLFSVDSPRNIHDHKLGFAIEAPSYDGLFSDFVSRSDRSGLSRPNIDRSPGLSVVISVVHSLYFRRT
jgi:hypothetical protein